MRAVEADWICARLMAAGIEKASPVANIGSSTAWFRTVRKPYIEERLFKPLREAGFEVLHVDIKAQDGVDLVADLSDPQVVDQLRERGFRSLICSNLLEHVEHPNAIAAACETIVEHGIMVVTVPYSYPFHPDPIDTLFRPAPAELATLFPSSRMTESIILTDGTIFDEEVNAGWRHVAIMPLRWAWLIFSGLWRPAIARAAASRIGHLFKPISVTCAVFERGA